MGQLGGAGFGQNPLMNMSEAQYDRWMLDQQMAMQNYLPLNRALTNENARQQSEPNPVLLLLEE